MNRRPAVAGTWYPAHATTLTRDVDNYLERAPTATPPFHRVHALIAPHAGLMYSGPTAGASFRAVQDLRFDVIVAVGPSHYLGFAGVAAWPDGAFETPLGPLTVAAADVQSLVRVSRTISVRRDAHDREHSLEMELPFLARLHPRTPIVPLVMGMQTRATVESLAEALAEVFANREVLFVASSDLSHFFEAETAEALDARVADLVSRFDAEGLMCELERYPEHERGRFVMCGGGPAVAVMLAAHRLGARDAVVLAQTHSGHVSGEMDRVVGYMAAAFGTREHS